ncbi:MAG: TetR/AcrR family transcriptional regulator [Gemmatimonadales bacterium]|nr:TetR/AcrR family transcriptional regulator [Gemmatimonadales bacterium]
MTEDRQDTKNRLLDAAENLFSHKGFEEVSIRELAGAADVNVAAVNYHFQGKDNLYREVIRRRFIIQRDRTLAAIGRVLTENNGKPPLDSLIRSIVSLYLDASLSPKQDGAFLKLIVRESHSNGDHATPLFFKEMVAPVFRTFSNALMQARPRLEQEQVDWIIASIIGQIHHFIMRWQKRQSFPEDSEALQIMLNAFPALGLPVEEYIQEVTRHITQFSKAAIDTLYPEVSP